MATIEREERYQNMKETSKIKADIANKERLLEVSRSKSREISDYFNRSRAKSPAKPPT